MTTGTADSWKVKLDDGRIQTLTLDQLDAAYKDGWVRGRTPVLPQGAGSWKPLRDVAGLDPSGSHAALPANAAAEALDVDVRMPMPSEFPVETRKSGGGKVVIILVVALVAALGIIVAATLAAPSIRAFVRSHAPGAKAPPAADATQAAPAKVETPKPPDAPAPPQAQAQAALPAPPATMNVSTLRTVDTPAAKKKGKRR
jgi:hypothetical protein